MTNEQLRIADHIISYLEELGVDAVFTVSGGGAIFLDDALAKNKKVNYYCCHHEQCVGMATEGYARVRNGLGVSLVTTGPGGTNIVTGVAGSWMDSVPHLILSGQVFLKQTIGSARIAGLRQIGVQEIDIVNIVRSITKYAVMVESVHDVKYHLQKAVYLATTGRPGPVWVDVPADIQMSKYSVEEWQRSHSFYPETLPAPTYDKDLREKVAAVAKLLRNAKRPLVHLGQGVRIAGAAQECFEVLETFNLPFVTARNANDMIHTSHPLFVGRPGTFAQRAGNFAVQNADVYLAVGTRLSIPQTGYNSKDYARNAVKIMVDIDEAELKKPTLAIDVAIHHDAKAFFQELHRQLTADPPSQSNYGTWVQQCQAWKQKYQVVLPEYKQPDAPVNSFYFIEVLSGLLGDDGIVVTDMGFAFQTTHMAFTIKKGQKVMTNCGFASMGWGLPAAIGACIANGKKQVICIAGEGGLQMTLQEFATIMHYKLPVKVFVYSNGGYLTIKQTQEFNFDGRLMGADETSGLSFPDILKVAEAHSIPGVRISSQRNLKETIQNVLDMPGPVVCDLVMDCHQQQIPKFMNRKAPDGKTLPTPLEDLYPYLPPEELRENMVAERGKNP
ncbi:thiamine pyrophosphate-binding protein [Candidatus Woesearchaeota archaeon]|nr:thiamine pyrophosphate-binding protein [Candidatus Woesearchaeota archaeon]